MQKENKWTVFFLVKSVDESIDDAIEMINELRREVDLKEDISIVLCLNIMKKYLPSLLDGRVDPFAATEESSETNVFYRLVKGDDLVQGFKNTLFLLGEDAEFELSNMDHIRGFFKKNILQKNLAQRYIIFTWDHGNGYGIFRDEQQTGDNFGGQESFNGQKFFLPVKHNTVPVPEVIFPNEQPAAEDDGILTMNELAAAIREAFDGRKVALLVMMNCYMQFFDTGYALREQVEYLVAPESYIHFEGYNYTFFFRRLAEAPDQCAKELAACLVNSFDIKFYKEEGKGIVARANTALFANDLSYYDLFADKIMLLLDRLNALLPAKKPEIIMARSRTIAVNTALFLVDFFYLLKNLQKALGKDWEAHLLNELEELREKIVIAGYVGNEFSNQSASAFPGGFAMYFPIRNPGGLPIGNSTQFFEDTDFANTSKWKDFINKFVEQ